MLKYGPILSINNGNSKTLIPRNSSYSNAILGNLTVNNSTVNNNSSSTSQSSANFVSATVTDLSVSTLALISNTSANNIALSSPIAFSFLKSDYQSNNFNLYPVFFSMDILINNKNFVLNSENVSIKDNVLVINSKLTNTTINSNQSDELISGFIFPIPDQNISTGFYAGLLYVPNNKIAQVSPTSTIYNWTNSQFNYFSNVNKGFFKLKYLPQSLDFGTYDNKMNSNYTDLIDNTTNLSNLHVGALGLGDGEITSMNNTNLSIKISDGITLFETINITKTDLNILNNLAIKFTNNLLIKDINDNRYIYCDSTYNFVTLYQNLFLNKAEYTINFSNLLNINSGTTLMMKLTASANKIELFGTTNITNLRVLNTFELNNIPIVFVNSLNIIGNGSTFINFDAVLNAINVLKPTYINILLINTIFNLNNNIPIQFKDTLQIRDSVGTNYITFNRLQSNITLLLPTIVDTFSITGNFNLLNDIPIVVNRNFTIQDNTTLFLNITKTISTFYNNILFATSGNPQIGFETGKIFTVTDSNKIINFNIDTAVNIVGPLNSYQDISSTIVNSSFTVTNTSAKDYNLTFTPITKLYILSGITQISSTLIFTCLQITNINNMSGKITGTTWALNTLSVNAYDINIWSYPSIDSTTLQQITNVGYNTLNPVNTTNNGDWVIQNIYLTQPNEDNIYNLNIHCVGSNIDRIVWGFKVDILQI